MNCTPTRVLACLLALSGLCISVTYVQGREVLNLDGIWDFATDTDDRGETDGWYKPAAKLPAMPLPGYEPSAKGKIRVPGIWDNQGYGTETDKVRHQFVGKGWYRRQVEIPQAWAGRRVFLAITGVSRYAKAWIDDEYLGEHVGFVSAFEWDITKHVVAGRTITITIQVDSKQRWAIDSMYGTASLADYMDVAWGGIWGHVSLEARWDAWLSDLYVRPDVHGSSCSVIATLNGKADLPDGVALEVFDKVGQRVAEATSQLAQQDVAGQPVIMKAPLPHADLWTPDSPTLYRARLTLRKGGQTIDALETRFGMRQYSSDGPNLLLNGKRLMLCGYGDDHIYPEQMALPSDRELHVSRLRTIKSYGFNFVRHHSAFMPPEYYDACDELGMITTAEFPIAYLAFIPGVGRTWKAEVPPGTDPGPGLETYKRQWEGAIKRYRNHPSILCWVRGNELYDEPTMRDDFARIAKQVDPDRWFVDTDGIHILDPKKERDTAPLYFVQFAEWNNPIDNPAKHKTPSPGRPVISHEAGNYLTFSRPDLVDQFRHNIKPFWLTPGKEKLEKLGLSQEANQWAEKSERLYLLLHKYNLESIRLNPYISGYHWWLFQDYWTTSNGIVDHYFRPKSITKEEVLKINNSVVLLQQGLEGTYRGKNRLNLRLLVSNFSPGPLQGDCAWEVNLGDQSLAKRRLPLRKAPQGELSEVAHIDLELPDTTSPTPLRVTVELLGDEKHFSNDWSSWLYPAVIHPAAFPVPVLAGASQINNFGDWGVRPIPSQRDLGDRAVYITDSFFDHRLVDAMNRGASVVLLGVADPFMTSYPVTFKTSWWKAGETSDTNYAGTFVYDHPLARAMAPAGWCDAGWFDLLEGGNKYVVEGMPARPNVIIRAIPSMLMIEDDALLFEVSVGKGSLIVSGLNHQRAAGRPENQWLLARILDYAATLPHPKASWPVSLFSNMYAAPDGCLPGFRRLTAHAGEVIPWYSYREDHARTFVCRQTKPGNVVTWETIPLPEKPASDRVTFVFAGSLGFSSQPKTDGFVLQINGKDALRFDMPAPERWQSADKRVELRFEPRRSVTEDQFGLFHVTIPRDMLKSGAPCQLGVRSLGSGSQRWFGLNPYSNAK